ncbi:MAG: 2-oxoacid:ferredoxin oxidoreductase subunit gamma [Chloroflexi bacterium RBG_13_46_9]|nr:MAG: 2-oxoacid:ferredoxin oxidoreductase subunit gamma [Chloroflexi bacterium RBG_13_46_9]
MLIKSVFAGFGGQGVLSMGLNLTQAAMIEGKHVTYLPAYGAEMRGGTANCTVAISDEEIASPVASSPQFVVVMNQPSLVRFQNQVDSNGVVFINTSLIEAEVLRTDVDVIKVAANQIAEELGSARSANMVMLGAFIKKSNLILFDTIVDVVHSLLEGKGEKLFAANKKALETGYRLIK